MVFDVVFDDVVLEVVTEEVVFDVVLDDVVLEVVAEEVVFDVVFDDVVLEDVAEEVVFDVVFDDVVVVVEDVDVVVPGAVTRTLSTLTSISPRVCCLDVLEVALNCDLLLRRNVCISLSFDPKP